MNGLTTLGTVLTVVFSVSILVLVVELVYILWWKRVYKRRSDPEQTETDLLPSKDQLLYFFCLKNASRVEPSTTTVVEPAVDDELAKWHQRLYGPTSRVLFTIKEEEEQEDSEAETDGCFSIQIVENDRNEEKEEEEATPFSTPCASPPYYTPPPSPSHDCHVSVC